MKTAKSKAKRGIRTRRGGAYNHSSGRRMLRTRHESTVATTNMGLMPVPTARTVAPLLNRAAVLRLQAAQLRPEFSRLEAQWRRETQHFSQISKKILHPAYFRIIGMGEGVVPLLLESLRDRPAHWFAALKATAGVDPVPEGANPSAARDVWLEWGTKHGLLQK